MKFTAQQTKFYWQRENTEFSDEVRVDVKDRSRQFWKRNPLSMEHSWGVSAGMLYRLNGIPYDPAVDVMPVKNYNITCSNRNIPAHSPILISTEMINEQTGTASMASAYLNQIRQRAGLLFHKIFHTQGF